MTWLQILILLALTFGILFVIRLRKTLAILAEQVRSLREHALEHVSYRPAGDLSVGDVDAATTEAERLGFVMLGDYVEESKFGASGRAMRWLVDTAGTTFGWMAPFDVDGQRHVLVVLMSHELDAQTITSRQPLASMLERPPFVTLQQLPVTTSLTETVAKHRERAGFHDADRAFIPVRTFEQVQRELDRMRDKVIAWRRAQPADELLDADLRSLLGPRYGKLGEALRRRLA